MNKKILIMRFGAIGDVVHTTSISQSIKKKHPNCEIHFLTSELIAPLLQNDPDLSKVCVFDMKKKDNLFYLLKLGFSLRKEKFDVIFNLQNSVRNSLLTKIAKPGKVVFRNKNRVHATDAFFNSAKEVFEDIEMPENLKLFVSEEIAKKIESKIEKYPGPFIVISPGGENDNARQGRIWPCNFWASLSEKLVERFGGTVFIVGSKNERKRHEEIAKNTSFVLFSGELTLDESAGLFSKADLFISGDSGPLHMASALDVKTIGIMGSTPALACGPYGKKCYAISPEYGCSGCGKKLCVKMEPADIYTPCIKTITPQIVFDFVELNKLLI